MNGQPGNRLGRMAQLRHTVILMPAPPILNYASPIGELRRQFNSKFTFQLLAVILFLLGLLALIIPPQSNRRGDRARLAAAKTDIANFETALDSFRSDVSRLPTANEGLKAL